MHRLAISTLWATLVLSAVAAPVALARGVNDKIRLADGDFCLDVNGSKQADGTEVFMLKCHDQSNQRWASTKSADNKDIIVGIGGFCLDVKAAHAAKGAATQIWKCHFGDNQKFEIAADGHIKEVATGKCLQASAAKDKAPVIIGDCGKTKLELWKFDPK